MHTDENADVHTGETPTCIPVNTMDSSIETYLKIFDAIHMGGNIPPCPAARYLDLSRHTDYLLFATFLVTSEDAKAYLYSFSTKRRVYKWNDIRVNLYI